MNARRQLLLSHGMVAGLATCMFAVALYYQHRALASADDGVTRAMTTQPVLILVAGFAVSMAIVTVLTSQWAYRGIVTPLKKLTQTLETYGLQGSLEAFKDHASTSELMALKDALTALSDAQAHHETLRQQTAQTQKMDAIGQLAGGVAHDFNNLLGGILGAADLLALRMDGSDDRRKFVDMIAETAQRATDLTARLLAFSRRGGDVSHAVDVHEAIRSAFNELTANIEDHNITITFDLEADPPLVTGDASQLQNVFYQLGVNSFDAMVDGGALTVRTQLVTLEKAYCDASPFDIDTGRFIEITVEDTGIGMPHDLQHRIFEPFFSTKKEGKGRGLGLASVYGTIKDHLGAITVSSELDKGTSFRICLPVEVKGSPNIVQDAAGELPSQGAHVLVVDDEEVIRITAENMLRDMGYQVLFATNGMEAIEMFKRYQDKIKLVILDLVMPVMDGHETLRELMALDSSVSVVISSGFACDASTREMLDEHASAFLRKPFRHRDLAAIMSNVMPQE